MRGLSNWLFLTIPVFVVALGLLVKTIRSLIHTVRESVVVSLPLQPEQRLTLSAPGPYALSVEGGFGSRDFSGLEFELRDTKGTAIPLRAVLFRTRVSTMSRVRLQLRSFDLPAAGAFDLRVTGIHATSSPDNRVVIGRPVGGAMVLHVVALVGLGAATIGSLVGSILLVVQPWRNPRS